MTKTSVSKWNFTNTITRIPTYVGCNDFPTSSQGMQLIALINEFINDEFPLLRPDDVDKAFKLAASGKLIENGKKIEPNTYGKHLSAAVVGKVLSAYVDHQKHERMRPKPNYNRLALPQHQKQKISDEDAWELVLKWTKEEKQLPFSAPYLGAYRYLIKNKQIKPVLNEFGESAADNMSGQRRERVERYLLQNVLNSKTEIA